MRIRRDRGRQLVQGRLHHARVESLADLQGVVTLLGNLLWSGLTLAMDQIGVGRAVEEMLTDALRGRVSCLFYPITITAGDTVTSHESGGLHVPKKELVGTLLMLLQSRRLRVSPALPQAAMLARKLAAFQVKVSTSAVEEMDSWREGTHDDLVLAVAVAAWLGERCLKRLTARAFFRVRHRPRHASDPVSRVRVT
jgi:hypothetical protein